MQRDSSFENLRLSALLCDQTTLAMTAGPPVVNVVNSRVRAHIHGL